MRTSHRMGVMAVGTALLMGSLAGVPASAADVTRQSNPSDVIFLGDSVTAGFGFFGAQENQISGAVVNNEFADNWVTGSSSLDKCDPPATPDDRCSNNNVNGEPWNAGPWTPGPGSPTVSYSYQIAAQQDPSAAATIENWAVTGSTPAQWDSTTGGVFGSQLTQIQNQQVVMTLGRTPCWTPSWTSRSPATRLRRGPALTPASTSNCGAVGTRTTRPPSWPAVSNSGSPTSRPNT